jgi:tRNA(His) guanylyltransferase
MAKSKFEYVKIFEEQDACLPETFIVIRIDGKGFTKFSDLHKFEKPNDLAALSVMNQAAKDVCAEFYEIFLAFGQSDEYSFVLSKESTLFQRRKEKILSTIVSLFSSSYTFHFERITGKPLLKIPAFDARIICYPNLKTLRDYFSWRQADCHINNLYNTCFWKLIMDGGKTNQAAENMLKNTLSDFKNELLFSQFGINYSKLDPIFRKGSLLVRKYTADKEKQEKMEKILKENPNAKVSKPRMKATYELQHVDLIQEEFWRANFPELFE